MRGLYMLGLKEEPELEIEKSLGENDDGSFLIKAPDKKTTVRISVYESNKAIIETINKNSHATYYGLFSQEIDKYSDEHLSRNPDSYKPPSKELVQTLFSIVKRTLHYTDRDLCQLMLLKDPRSIRDYKSGNTAVPQRTWHLFLVKTGYLGQQVHEVVGLF